MVNLVPAVQLGKFETAVEFKESLSKAGFLSAQYLFATQFILFFAGVVLIGLFAILNYRLVGQAPPRVPPPPVVGT
jgi:hypothetical protein